MKQKTITVNPAARPDRQLPWRGCWLLLLLCLAAGACTNNDDDYPTHLLTVAVTLRDGTPMNTDGMEVVASDSRGTVYRQPTNAQGVALFHLPDDIYQIAVSHRQVTGGHAMLYNGIETGVIVNADRQATLQVDQSEAGTIVIQELYVGGCQRDDGSGTFQRDKYVILYNNCDQRVSLDNLCLGVAVPLNAYGMNDNYDNAGNLTYADSDFIPAASAIWTFQEGITFEPFSQVVIALNGAIDHTQTYRQSVDLSLPEYYCTYDISRYDNTLFYPSPSERIPSAHYLRAWKYGDQGEDAWPLSTSSPAFFIFTVEGQRVEDFAMDSGNLWYDGGVVRSSNACKKVPRKWVLDAVEVFSSTSQYNEKRLTADLDAGYVTHTPRQGHALHRKTDEQQTAANGGRTVYQDTNNSSSDFEQRDKASLAK